MDRCTTISANPVWQRMRGSVSGNLVSMALQLPPPSSAAQDSRECRCTGRGTKIPHLEAQVRWNDAAEESAKLAEFTRLRFRWAAGASGRTAKAVLSLSSDGSSYINAVELMVDGGVTVRLSGLPFFADNPHIAVEKENTMKKGYYRSLAVQVDSQMNRR